MSDDKTRGGREVTDNDLFIRQKKLLDTFLERGAITQAQHDFSLNCLIQKMKNVRKDGE